MRKRTKIAAVVIASAAILSVGGWFIAKRDKPDIPEEYIADTYPDAEILSYKNFGGFMGGSGSVIYYCRDKTTGIYFEQRFYKKGIFNNTYANEKDQTGYQEQFKKWETDEELLAIAEEFLQAEHISIHNPLRKNGIVLITKNESADNIESLREALDKKIAEVFVADRPSYSIIDCQDRLFEKMKTVDWDKIYHGTSGTFCSFYEIAEPMGLSFERITAAKYDRQLFVDRGDDPVQAEDFDETAINVSKNDIWVFGVDL